MAVTELYHEFVIEQLSRVSAVTSRHMFGGVGIYADGLFFAIIDNNTLYFKVDETNRPDYEHEGMDIFRPYGPDGASMQYYQVPAEILEDSDRLRVWMERSVNVARRKKAG